MVHYIVSSNYINKIKNNNNNKNMKKKMYKN